LPEVVEEVEDLLVPLLDLAALEVVEMLLPLLIVAIPELLQQEVELVDQDFQEMRLVDMVSVATVVPESL
jgi:hypothetical protein